MRCHRAVLAAGIAAVVVLVCRGVLVLGFFLNDYDVKNNNNKSSPGGPSSGGATNTLYNELLTLRLEGKGRRRNEAYTSVPEAVMVAVHVKKSGQSTSSSSPSDDKYNAGISSSSSSVEQLAVQRVVQDDGVNYSSTNSRGEPLRVFVDAHVVYENDSKSPRSKTQLESWLGGLPVNKSALIEASQATERAVIGEPFDVFSGIYGAAVKARALRWLAVRLGVFVR